MILHDYVRLLRRGWWVIVLCALIGAGAGAALAHSTTPTYTSQASVYVSLSGNGTPNDLQTGNVFGLQRAPTYAHLAVSSAVLDRAAAALADGTTADDLRGSVTASAYDNSAMVVIAGTGSSAVAVADRVNAVASALTAEAPLLDAPTRTSPVQLTVVDTAQVPSSPVSPKTRNDILVGLAAGLVLGVAVIVIADALDTRIRTLAGIPRSAALATLTSIPTGRARRPGARSSSDARLESIRNLRANLQFGTQAGRVIAVAAVTSASDAAGVARQLGTALAEIGAHVVVADLDLRPRDSRRRRHRREGDPDRRVGVADVLNGGSTIDEALAGASDTGPQVSVLPAGIVDAASAQRLSTPAMIKLLDTLKARFDYVLLACPPLVDRSESAVAAALADSCLLIVESGATKRSEFLYAMELLAGVRVSSISVAIDHVRDVDLGHTSGQRDALPEQLGSLPDRRFGDRPRAGRIGA